MKFGKSIRAEARNNRTLAFINFKYLKRILKRSITAASKHNNFRAAIEEDRLFHNVLENELAKVRASYWKELLEIQALQVSVEESFHHLDIKPNPELYARMTFAELQTHLQNFSGNGGGSENVAKASATLCEFCVAVGKISSRCKHLRRCVLWNAVAIVKIFKKRHKHRNRVLQMQRQASRRRESQSEAFFALDGDCADSGGRAAAEILRQQDWYRCNRLRETISLVETMIESVMQKLTQQPPSREPFRCPICLDVILDPVCLRTCGHRFCWACLCMAYCASPEGALERCPCCRSAFPLDPAAFEVDGILGRFLRAFFPEELNEDRVERQREHLRERFEFLSHGQPNNECAGKKTHSSCNELELKFVCEESVSTCDSSAREQSLPPKSASPVPEEISQLANLLQHILESDSTTALAATLAADETCVQASVNAAEIWFPASSHFSDAEQAYTAPATAPEVGVHSQLFLPLSSQEDGTFRGTDWHLIVPPRGWETNSAVPTPHCQEGSEQGIPLDIQNALRQIDDNLSQIWYNLATEDALQEDQECFELNVVS